MYVANVVLFLNRRCIRNVLCSLPLKKHLPHVMLIAVIEHNWQQSCRRFRAVDSDIRETPDQRRDPSDMIGMRVSQNECIETIQLIDFRMKIISGPRLDAAIDHDSMLAQFYKVAAPSHFSGTAQRHEPSGRLRADLDRRWLSISRISLEEGPLQIS